MASITLTETVQAPPQRVWEVFTDLDLFEREVEGIQSVERIDGDGFQVGTKWRETRVMYGREATEVMWVTSCEAPQRYVVEAESHGAHYRTEYRFTADGGGTRVTVEFGAEPTNTLTKLVSPIMFRAMKKSVAAAMGADLRALKVVAERDA